MQGLWRHGESVIRDFSFKTMKDYKSHVLKERFSFAKTAACIYGLTHTLGIYK